MQFEHTGICHIINLHSIVILFFKQPNERQLELANYHVNEHVKELIVEYLKDIHRQNVH